MHGTLHEQRWVDLVCSLVAIVPGCNIYLRYLERILNKWYICMVYGIGLKKDTLGLGWRKIPWDCTKCWKYPGLGCILFGGKIMWGGPKKGVKLDDSGLSGLLMEWGFVLALVVGNGLTSAVVLVIGVVLSGVPGAWKMLSVPCLLSNWLLDRDLWGQSLCVSTHSREGQIVPQDSSIGRLSFHLILL